MNAPQVAMPSPGALKQALMHRIVHRTNGQVIGLTVDIIGDRIVVQGRARSFHLKQLAIQGTFDVISWWDGAGVIEIDMQIAVVSPDAETVLG